MSTSGVAASVWRKSRTISTVLCMVCPALSARCEDIWIAGPSAIGSVKGMPSSTMSAPAAGIARRMASEVCASGSPAVRNVTSAARPCAFSSAKRRSMRVLMAISLENQSAEPLRPRPHTAGNRTLEGPQHNSHERADELDPSLLLHYRTGREQPHAQEIGDIGGRYDNQNPADELLPADHRSSPPSARLMCAVAPD